MRLSDVLPAMIAGGKSTLCGVRLLAGRVSGRFSAVCSMFDAWCDRRGVTWQRLLLCALPLVILGAYQVGRSAERRDIIARAAERVRSRSVAAKAGQGSPTAKAKPKTGCAPCAAKRAAAAAAKALKLTPSPDPVSALSAVKGE